jgi:murein DD-endopeptidase MepM/ murein hydrolase activator NlpD
VLAARAGTVVFLESRYFESGLDRAKYLSRSNQVRILHDDGSMASYAHLFPDSIDLEPGQRVEQGQRLGLSGNTGYSSGPHLHFVVLVHRDMEMVSVPFVKDGVPRFSRAP